MFSHLRMKLVCAALIAVSLGIATNWSGSVGHAQVATAPVPLLEKGKPPVDWWFVFKFNTKSFPGCAGQAQRQCIFGGEVQEYTRFGFGQQFIYTSTGVPFKKGNTCVGNTTKDPLGATFDQVYNGSYFFVIWNDQFYADPDLPQCHNFGYCGAPWAHSKGMLAWNANGDGFVLQVTTPNWPAAGNRQSPRERNGNTLGCLTSDGEAPQNNVLVSQHFFSLKLNKEDVLKVLGALQNAGVVTQHDPNADDRDQVINNGGPSDIRQAVDRLGELPNNTRVIKETLSSGVQIISKPARLAVPPWQMVSAVLGGVPLKVATWYSAGKIPDTDGTTMPDCWDASLGQPGAVTNVQTGHWGNKSFGLTGAASPDRNHAKIGVSTTGNLSIFGDMNQEGALSGNCKIRQNPRGGLFYVVEDQALARQMRDLLSDGGSDRSNARGRRAKR
jgi:Deoxyribonuclease II